MHPCLANPKSEEVVQIEGARILVFDQGLAMPLWCGSHGEIKILRCTASKTGTGRKRPLRSLCALPG
jgi:hypothetical protein